ncbi:MAG: hypothetical protein AAGG47_17860 [Pseudomonadota bacterium]
MMSFSNEVGDQNGSFIVQPFADAQQFCDREALRQRIERLADADARKTCHIRLAYAEEHTHLSEELYRVERDKYVAEKLKQAPALELRPGGEPPTYQQRVEQLRAEYAQTQEGQALQAFVQERERTLWEGLTRTLERFEGHPHIELDRKIFE